MAECLHPPSPGSCMGLCSNMPSTSPPGLGQLFINCIWTRDGTSYCGILWNLYLVGWCNTFSVLKVSVKNLKENWFCFNFVHVQRYVSFWIRLAWMLTHDERFWSQKRLLVVLTSRQLLLSVIHLSFLSCLAPPWLLWGSLFAAVFSQRVLRLLFIQ